MKPVPVEDFWYFGTCFRYLQDVTVSFQVHGRGYVYENLQNLSKHMERLGLVVSMQTAAYYQLLETRAALASNKDDKLRLTEDQAKSISGAISDLRKTLAAELSLATAYLLAPKRYGSEQLMSKPSELIGRDIFLALPEIAQFDIGEACKCIALERPTAAAFHLMRGLEAVLRAFYRSVVKRNRVTSELWGPLVADMRRRSGLQAHKALFDHLDNIRVNFRNPTQHPEAKYDVTEAQNLLGVCIDVLTRMAPALQIM